MLDLSLLLSTLVLCSSSRSFACFDSSPGIVLLKSRFSVFVSIPALFVMNRSVLAFFAWALRSQRVIVEDLIGPFMAIMFSKSNVELIFFFIYEIIFYEVG